MRWEVHQSFAFLRGIEPASRVDSFETTMSQITDGDIVATLEETGKKRGLEESIQGLQASMKSSTDTFSKLSKQFANKLQIQPEMLHLTPLTPLVTLKCSSQSLGPLLIHYNLIIPVSIFLVSSPTKTFRMLAEVLSQRRTSQRKRCISKNQIKHQVNQRSH